MLAINDAFKKINGGNYLPIYLWVGEEEYLKERLLQTLCDNYLGEGEARHRVRRVEGKEISLAWLLEDLRRPDLFSGGREIVVFKNPPFLKSAPTAGKKEGEAAEGELEEGSRESNRKSSKKKAGQEEENLLTTFWEEEKDREVPTGIVVLWAPAADRRKKIFRFLEQNQGVVNCAPLRGEALKKWIKKEASRWGKEIPPAAVEKLLISTEGDMQRISREINKLATYLEEGETSIPPELVDELVYRSPQGNIFQLTDALGERDLALAHQQLLELFQSGEPPIKILFMIVRHFRLLTSAFSWLQSGRSKEELPSLLQVPPFVARKLHTQAKGYRMEELVEIYQILHQIDLEIKRGQVDPHQGLELLLGRLYQAQ